MSRMPNLDQVLIWKDRDTTLAHFELLVKSPPLRSVVVDLHPAGAAVLQERFRSSKNRALSQFSVEQLTAIMKSGQFEMTGDTIKIGDNGHLLDGQHRIDGVIKSGVAIRSHMVFGLNPEVFDVLDQNKGRSAADIMHIAGVKESLVVAAASRWVLQMQNRNDKMTPRELLKIQQEEFPDLSKYTGLGRDVALAFKHVPHLRVSASMVTAMAWMIGTGRSMSLAREFFTAWMHGGQVERNKVFTVLAERLMTIWRTGGENVSPRQRVSLLIQAFNFWNAHEVPAHASLRWKKGQEIPTLYTDANVFRGLRRVRTKEEARDRNAPEAREALNEKQIKVLQAIVSVYDPVDGVSQITQAQITKLTGLSNTNYVIKTLMDQGYITNEGGGRGTDARYRVNQQLLSPKS